MLRPKNRMNAERAEQFVWLPRQSYSLVETSYITMKLIFNSLSTWAWHHHTKHRCHHWYVQYCAVDQKFGLWVNTDKVWGLLRLQEWIIQRFTIAVISWWKKKFSTLLWHVLRRFDLNSVTGDVKTLMLFLALLWMTFKCSLMWWFPKHFTIEFPVMIGDSGVFFFFSLLTHHPVCHIKSSLAHILSQMTYNVHLFSTWTQQSHHHVWQMRWWLWMLLTLKKTHNCDLWGCGSKILSWSLTKKHVTHPHDSLRSHKGFSFFTRWFELYLLIHRVMCKPTILITLQQFCPPPPIIFFFCLSRNSALTSTWYWRCESSMRDQQHY